MPIGILALFAIAAVLHIPAKRVPHKIDWLGHRAHVLGRDRASSCSPPGAGRSTPGARRTIIGLGVVAVALLVAFCSVESKAVEPLIPLGLFKNRTFSAASAVGFIIGFSMFGAIIYLPLYLQTVHGATPTASGLELLPLVAGMLATFILSGQLVTRTGRYKVFPIVGSAVLAVGLCLLSRMGVTPRSGSRRSTWSWSASAWVWSCRCWWSRCRTRCPTNCSGSATSTATFFRTIGGAFGVSLLNCRVQQPPAARAGQGARTARGAAPDCEGSSIVANPAA